VTIAGPRTPGWLEALIREARRHARRRRVAVAVLAVAVIAVSAGLYFQLHGSDATGVKHSARLTITTNNPRIGHGARAIFHLSCKPPGGDVPSPQLACASIGLISEKLPLGYRCPKPSRGGLWVVGNTTLSISGRLDGKALNNVIRDPCRTRPTSDLIGQILSVVGHDPSYPPFKKHVIERY